MPARGRKQGGGACAVGGQRSHLFGAVLKDADQAVLGEGAEGFQEGLDHHAVEKPRGYMHL